MSNDFHSCAINLTMSKLQVFQIFVKLIWPLSSTIKATNNETLQKTTKMDEDRKPSAKTLNKYWPNGNRTLNDVIVESDRLYEERQYIEVYELLNRLKYSDSSDIKWRIARVLYKTTVDMSISNETKSDMVMEAYDLLKEETAQGKQNANVHKWYAILLDAKNRLLNLNKRVEGYEEVIEHLRLACKLDPYDLASHYMLGHLCYKLANMSKFERFLAKTLFTQPPVCTFDEAYKYLQRTEELSQQPFLLNIYLLGKTCYKLKQFYRAKHYLTTVCYIEPKNHIETLCVAQAKNLLKKLDRYTLGREILLGREFSLENRHFVKPDEDPMDIPLNT